MKLIFGTTNARKIEDLQNIINELGLDVEVLSTSDIGWDRWKSYESDSESEGTIAEDIIV